MELSVSSGKQFKSFKNPNRLPENREKLCALYKMVIGGLNHNIIYCNHDKCGAKWKMQMSQGIPLHIVSICISPVSRIFD